MYVDANTLDDGTLIEGDVCIVGAGAAGIAMALDWAGTAHDVVLLEGGGFEVESEMQELYRGENVGQRYFPLQSARLHYFGGTTGHWAGWCARLDPWDFEERDWVPHSGWPIALDDLEPYYRRAEPIVQLGPPEAWDADYWEMQSAELAQMPLDPSKVWTKMWQFSPPTRFGVHYREDIVQAPNIHLYTHANVCDIRANDNVSAVEELEIRCLNGKSHRVRARHFVLACGAIQNARLLLASNRQAPNGLGNDHDLVGRYFMEHIEAPSAFMVVANPGPMSLYLLTPESYVGRGARGELALSFEQQREHRILNCSTDLTPDDDLIPDAQANRIDGYPETAQGVVEMMNGFMRAMKGGGMPELDVSQIAGFSMQCRSETAPNPDSRVMLADDKDALGVPRVKLDWRLTELDERTLRKTFEVIGTEAGRAGIGRLQLRDWLLEEDPFAGPNSLAAAGWHHMGTARMHHDPQQGVVDPHCKVHGLSNLFVAGSAAFPTSGSANPTLSLIALTLRLSDHLKSMIG